MGGEDTQRTNAAQPEAVAYRLYAPMGPVELAFTLVPIAVMGWFVLGAMLGRPPQPSEAAWLVLAWAGAVALGVPFLSMRLIVGTDGVCIERGRRSHFVSFASLKSAKVQDAYVALWLFNKEVVLVRVYGVQATVTFGTWTYSLTKVDKRNQIVNQIERAHARYRAPASPPECHFLARMGMDVATWVDRLRSLGRGAGPAYRDATVSKDWLWSIVETPSVRVVQRAAAAVVLGAAGDPRSLARLRSVALATANPSLRMLLELASTEIGGEHLEQALGKMELDESAETTLPSELAQAGFAPALGAPLSREGRKR